MDDEVWMRNHLGSDNKCNIILSTMTKVLQGMTNDVGLHLVSATPHLSNLQLVLSKTCRIGDTKYNI